MWDSKVKDKNGKSDFKCCREKWQGMKAILVYRLNSRTARATQRNPVSGGQKKKRVGFCFVSSCELYQMNQPGRLKVHRAGVGPLLV